MDPVNVPAKFEVRSFTHSYVITVPEHHEQTDGRTDGQYTVA